ncbi:UNVERIFIED_CONTAM: hypothetical protein NCL1_06136 [Trichonephila clavipes]
MAGLKWYWARTRDKASHDPMPIPLGYRGHLRFVDTVLLCRFILAFCVAHFQLHGNETKLSGERKKKIFVNICVVLRNPCCESKEL